ncbi:MAG: hypothetical protein ACRD6N_00825 [Pyrinomonadaceae bacterium]
MPKDNENIPLPDLGPLTPSEPQGFAPEQMIRCEKCQRANPPTRVNCLYCATPFAFNEKTASLQKPTLRPLEKWEQGYSNILVPASGRLDNETVDQVAALLKLGADQLKRILESATPLPLARAATYDEALLIERRLKDFGLSTLVVSDTSLGMEASSPLRVRAAEIDEKGMMAFLTGGAANVYYYWSALTLLVQGRLVVKSVEVKERKIGRENHVVRSSETYMDEAVVDIYSQSGEANLRIGANSFDFSCLGDQKGLLAEENFTQLLRLIRDLAPTAAFDDSYKAVRQSIEPIWSSEGQTESRGWRRERMGKFTLGAVTEISNEVQFTRYSRLRHYFHRNPVLKPDTSDLEPV